MTDLVKLTIDGVPVEVPKGTLLVEAAKTVKQEIPVYCYHPKLGPAGLCRVCLVEIEGTPKLQIACNTPVAEGMVVHTRNEKVDAGRGIILELLLVNHPLDCPICDKGGECDLQDYAMAYGRGSSDVADPKLSKPKGVDLGPTIVLDEERCVVCQRCVRFDDIIADERQLIVKDRGHNDIIATATGAPYNHHFTGNVTEICPVGALTSKTYRFKSRPWDLRRTQTTCTQCPVGCQMFSDVRHGNVLRTMSVEHDDRYSDSWLCDRGRYNIGFYTAPDRITQPMYRREGGFVQIGWDDAFTLWARAIKGAGGNAGAIGGGRLLNEEAFLTAAGLPRDRRAQSRLARWPAAASFTGCAQRRLRGARTCECHRYCGSVVARRARPGDVAARAESQACGCNDRPRHASRRGCDACPSSQRREESRSCGTASILSLEEFLPTHRADSMRKRISPASSPMRAARKRWGCYRSTAAWMRR